MSDIRPEIRELAVSWAEANKYDWIGDKHKLASDIQNYSDWYNSLLQAKIDRYEAALREIESICDPENGDYEQVWRIAYYVLSKD